MTEKEQSLLKLLIERGGDAEIIAEIEMIKKEMYDYILESQVRYVPRKTIDSYLFRIENLYYDLLKSTEK